MVFFSMRRRSRFEGREAAVAVTARIDDPGLKG
jgi:hypothetical protein